MKSIVLLVGVFFFLSCGKKEDVIKPIQRSITESVYASGTIESRNQYTAFASASGIVNRIYLTEGDTVVNSGAVLSISNVAQQLNKENAELLANFNDLSSNQGKLNQALQSIQLAKFKMQEDSLNYARQQQLAEKNVNAKIDLESAALQYQNAKLNYTSAQTNYSDLKRQLDLNAKQAKNNLRIVSSSANDFTLKSMLNGVLYALNVSVGEIVSPQTPIAIIGEKNNFILKMQVDEYDIGTVQIGQKVLVVLNSDKENVYMARVSKIYPLMNTATRTFLVEANFTKRPVKMYPNVSFEANIVVQTKENALLIPREYLSSDNKVTLKSGKKVTVKTGLKDYKMIEIVSGLKSSDEIVKPTE